jgi:hypothetical protein
MVMRHLLVRQRSLVTSTSLCAMGWLACSDFASEHDRITNDPPREPSTLASSAWDCTTSGAVDDPLVYSEATSLALAIQVIDIFTRATPPNLQVRACLITDLACERPITTDLSADAHGIVNVPLAIGLSGFLELTADGVAPGLFVLPGPLSVELSRLLGSRAVVLVPDGSPAGPALPIRTQSTADTGTLLVTVFDCAGRGADGVRLEVDSPAVPFAIIDGLPIINQRTTTSYAIAGFINVAPGVAVVSGYRTDTVEIVGRAAIPVRPGWDTLVTLLPQQGLEP